MVLFFRGKSIVLFSVESIVPEKETAMSANVKTMYIIRRVENIRSDVGGEYLSDQFQKWLEDPGIVHELTTGHFPESNGRKERLNMTLMDMARCMMQKLSIDHGNTFWAEAVNTASHV